MNKIILLLAILTACGESGPLKVQIVNCPRAFEKDIKTSIAAWENGVGFQLFKVTDNGYPIRCVTRQEWISKEFCGDVPNTVVGCASLSKVILPIHLLHGRIDRKAIIAHELGHFLGYLQHSEDENDIMSAYTKPDQENLELTENDIKLIRENLRFNFTQ